ncbi:MAG TPA: glycosyltransferase family 4 protein [Patescibacteria group bacterium]|nr:glycosyltransferase family 4 protein [Patescibacteria group bacterium]
MKIVFLVNHLNATDGWSRYTLDLATNLQAQGHEVHCLVNKKSAADFIQYDILGSPLRYLANPFLSFTTALKINKIIAKIKPDIIHITTETYATFLPFIKLKSAKTVLTVHGTYAYQPHLLANPFKRWISSMFTNYLYQKVDRVIAVSHYTKDHLLKNLPTSHLSDLVSKKITVITNGLDLSSFPPTSSAVEKNHVVKNILFVGGVKSGKGILETLAGLADYKNNFSDQFQFTIVGSFDSQSKYYLSLKDFIAEEKLNAHVVFLGRISDAELLSHYQSADLFLMPSLNIDGKWIEGFGLVYLEAASQGVPCLGSTESGASDAIIDGQTGYLINAHNPAGMAEKLDLILNKRPIKPEDCVAWAVKNDIKLKVGEVEDIYNKLSSKLQETSSK